MYNEEMKRAYLKSIENDAVYRKTYIQNLISTFGKTAEYELKLNKDVANFNIDEIMDMYSTFGVAVSSLKTITTQLRGYATYRVGADNAFNQISASVLRERIQTEKRNNIITKAEIDEILESLVNPIDKFFLYGLFCGIKGESNIELSASSMKDSDEEEKSFWLAGTDNAGNIIEHGRKFYADDRLFTYALEASKANFYIQETKDGYRKKVPVRNVDRSIYKIPMAFDDSNNFITRMSRGGTRLRNMFRANHLSENYKPGDILWSGLIYNLKKIGVEYDMPIKTLKDIKALKQVADLERIEDQYQVDIKSRSFKDALKKYL